LRFTQNKLYATKRARQRRNHADPTTGFTNQCLFRFVLAYPAKRMIPKSGNRFSDKIMPEQKMDEC